MSTSETTNTVSTSTKADTIKTNIVLVDAKAGNDRVTGGSAAQTIYGGSGNDTIQGAGGDDILWGDGSSTSASFVAGKDNFVFEKTLVANGVDTVMDFGIAGHKIAGELQSGTYVADTLDLSRIKFTGQPTHIEGEHDDDGEGDHDGACEQNDESEEVHINAANANNYITIKGGDLYIDADGLGAGQAQVWAHLNGVSGGDLVNLKFDDFKGQIEAQNALAAITGKATDALSEDDISGVVSGTLTAVDTDRGENVFQAVTANDLQGTYGSFSFNKTNGAWSFTLDSAAAQALQADESFDQVLTVKSLDGTATQAITVTITGVNDAAVITGTSTASLTETDAVLTASGTLTATDVDSSNAFVAQSGVAGSNGFGVFAIDANGAWTYSAGAHNEFVKDQVYTDSLTVATADGTSQVLTVSITGTNDAAVITGSSTASLTETDAVLTASGTLTATDVDGSAAFVAQSGVAGSNSYGTFSIAADGNWSYSAGAHNEFVKDEVYTDSLTVATADGTTQVLSVTITGTNDAAVITGTSTASLTETNAVLTANGTLTATDVDSSNAFVAQSGVAGSNSYGTFSIAADGNWSYSAGAHNEFVKDQVYTDSLTVATADGTTQVLSVSITGTNDAAQFSGETARLVNEDTETHKINGILSVTDADYGQTGFLAVGSPAPDGRYGVVIDSYGNFRFFQDTGNWSYVLNSEKAQMLQAGESVEQTLTVTSLDGTATQAITVTVQGVQDAADIKGDTTGSVTEDGTLFINGTLHVKDADHGQTGFLAVGSPALDGSYGEVNGSYGVFRFFQDTGDWTYLLNNTLAQPLRSDDHTSEVLTVTSLDGTATQDITVTIIGSIDRVNPPNLYTGTGDSADAITATATTTTATSGNDTLVGTANTDNLVGLAGADLILGLSAADRLDGGAGNDTIYGGEGSDSLTGSTDNDLIFGGSGRDSITSGTSSPSSGGFGADILVGGFGGDLLYGATVPSSTSYNLTADIFKFVDIRDTGDTIYAFTTSQDLLDFSVIDANSTTDDNEVFTLQNTMELQAYGINWFVANGNTIVQFDNDGVTSTAEFDIRLMGNTGLTALTSANFTL